MNNRNILKSLTDEEYKHFMDSLEENEELMVSLSRWHNMEFIAGEDIKMGDLVYWVNGIVYVCKPIEDN